MGWIISKYLFLDTGLLLSWLGIPASDILLATDVELVNKGPVAELLAGLEIIKFKDCFQRDDNNSTRHIEIYPLYALCNIKSK